jgi:uncharacterized DUF497 family protein
MKFSWNAEKARTNRTKHGVDFETATKVWDDPFCVVVPERVQDGEQRWHAIGLVAGVLLLLVVHIYPDDQAEDLVRIIGARKFSPMKEGNMKKELSARQLADLEKLAAILEKLAAIPDDQIDLVDIPEAPVENWAFAHRPNLYKAVKQPVTIRLDADVIRWFKDHSAKGGYQTEINRVLRKHVLASVKQTT